MSVNLNELVREQILAEGPQIGDVYDTQAEVEYARGVYVTDQLNAMTNVELLERISDALEHGVRVQWLYNLSYHPNHPKRTKP